MGKPGQTEITLKDDLPDRDKIDLYKTYLLYCLTGEVTRIPFGAQITTKRDDSEYLLLNQLGGILGLTSKEIVNIHVGLVEQAFRQQAEVILADGQLTKARVEQLDELQKQVGLPQPQAEKVIKNITTTKMANAIETAVNQGRLNIKQICELKETNVSLNSMIAVSRREKLFKMTVNDIFSSGTGEFDETEVYETIPSDLCIDVEKAKGVVHDFARSRLSNSLIQSVALLRQRNAIGVVSLLNDLLACDKAMPAEPLSWEVSEELSDLYDIYSKSDTEKSRVKENLSDLDSDSENGNNEDEADDGDDVAMKIAEDVSKPITVESVVTKTAEEKCDKCDKEWEVQSKLQFLKDRAVALKNRPALQSVKCMTGTLRRLETHGIKHAEMRSCLEKINFAEMRNCLGVQDMEENVFELKGDIVGISSK